MGRALLPIRPKTSMKVIASTSALTFSAVDWEVELPLSALTRVKDTKSQLLLVFYNSMVAILPKTAVTQEQYERFSTLQDREDPRVRSPFMPLPEIL